MNEPDRETFENESGKISEPLPYAIINKVTMPVICIGHYFVIFMLVFFLIVQDDRPPAVILLTGLAVCFGVVMLPVWYKAFFKRDYVSAGRLMSVEWSPDRIAFRGAYSYLEVSPEDVLSFRTSGFRRINQAFALTVWIRGPDGSKQRAFLNTTMSGKQKFLDFLEHNAKPN